PMEIFLGGTAVVDGLEVVIGYPGFLAKYLGTGPHWVLALLLTAWTMWGLLGKQAHRAAGGAVVRDEEARELTRVELVSIRGLLLLLSSVVLAVLLGRGSSW